MALKKKDLDKFEKLLKEEKVKILKHLENLSDSAEKDLENTGLSGDSADLASLEINQANIQKIGKRESQLLKKIDIALNKISQKTFGECETCGEDINLARLQARPVAQLCIDCKTEQENEERRYSTGEAEEGSEDDMDFQEAEEG